MFVSGQVNKPNSYPLRDGSTLMQAVALAGGFTRDAHRKMVLLARPVGDRQLQVREIDMQELLSHKGASHDEPLQDGDYIFVRGFKRLAKFSHGERSLQIHG